jgi:ribosomal protein L6P/L9E
VLISHYRFTKSTIFKIKEKKNYIEIYIYGPLGAACKRFYRKLVKVFLDYKNHRIFFNFKVFQKVLVKTYISTLIKVIAGVYLGFKCSLDMRGIGYSIIKPNSRSLGLKLGFDSLTIFLVPRNIQFIVDKKNLIIYSLDFQKITQLVFILKGICRLDVYKGKGLFIKGTLSKLKLGKRLK